jgi:hypothetical protein
MTKAALITLMNICLALAGCSTTRTVALGSVPGVAVPNVKAGDSVRITMKSGEARRLKLSAVDANTLTGKDLDARGSGTIVQIAMTDVQSLEQRRFSTGRTAGLTIGVIVGIATLVVGALLYAECGGNGHCGD